MERWLTGYVGSQVNSNSANLEKDGIDLVHAPPPTIIKPYRFIDKSTEIADTTPPNRFYKFAWLYATAYL